MSYLIQSNWTQDAWEHRYWNPAVGWTDVHSATTFTDKDAQHLPVDGHWVSDEGMIAPLRAVRAPRRLLDYADPANVVTIRVYRDEDRDYWSLDGEDEEGCVTEMVNTYDTRGDAIRDVNSFCEALGIDPNEVEFDFE